MVLIGLQASAKQSSNRDAVLQQSTGVHPGGAQKELALVRAQLSHSALLRMRSIVAAEEILRAC